MTRVTRLVKILGVVLVLVIPALPMACGSDEPSDGAASTPGQASGATERTTPTSAGADPTATTAERETSTSSSSGSSDSDIAAYCDQLAALGEGESEDESMTWGEATQQTTRILDQLDDVAPPQELEGYHRAMIALMQGLRDLYRSQDADQILDQEVVNSDPVTTGLAFGILAVYSEMDEETLSQVENSGCGVSVS